MFTYTHCILILQCLGFLKKSRQALPLVLLLRVFIRCLLLFITTRLPFKNVVGIDPVALGIVLHLPCQREGGPYICYLKTSAGMGNHH